MINLLLLSHLMHVLERSSLVRMRCNKLLMDKIILILGSSSVHLLLMMGHHRVVLRVILQSRVRLEFIELGHVVWLVLLGHQWHILMSHHMHLVGVLCVISLLHLIDHVLGCRTSHHFTVGLLILMSWGQVLRCIACTTGVLNELALRI